MINFAFVRCKHNVIGMSSRSNTLHTGQVGVQEQEGGTIDFEADADSAFVTNTPANQTSSDS